MRSDASIQAVLFDVAGTLIRLRDPMGETYARLALNFGVVCPPGQIESAFRRIFHEMPPMVFPHERLADTPSRERQWWQELVERVFRQVDDTLLFTNFGDYFDSLFQYFSNASAWQAIDGAWETLAALRARGLRTGVVSNFDHRLGGLLDGLGLAPLLDVIVRAADAGAAKPDRRIFELALRRLDVAPSRTLYVGDAADQDVAGAQAAGLRAINVASLRPFAALLEHLGP